MVQQVCSMLLTAIPVLTFGTAENGVNQDFVKIGVLTNYNLQDTCNIRSYHLLHILVNSTAYI